MAKDDKKRLGKKHRQAASRPKKGRAPKTSAVTGAVAPKTRKQISAKKALAEVASGQVLKILSTDPGSVKDFAAFAKQTGNELLSTAEAGGEFTFFMKKK